MSFYIAKRAKTTQLIIGLILLIFVLFFSYMRAMKEPIGGDFHVFWQAGQDLWQQLPLYETRPGLREFLYPPFSALFFSFYSFFPFKVATYIFFLTNFVLWAYSFKILHGIFQNLSQNKVLIRRALWFSFFMSFKFYWNNTMMVQSNLIVYIFTLLGIANYFLNKENKAIVFFAIATSIKLTPVFFFFWIIFQGKLKSFCKALFSGAFFIVLPMFISGFSRGWSDLSWYAEHFVFKFLTVSHVSVSYANQALSSTLHRVFTDMHEVGRPTYTLFNLGILATGNLYKVLFVLIFATVLITIILNRKIKKTAAPEIPSIIVLSMLLLSGISWKAHLLSLSFVYVGQYLLYDRLTGLYKKSWWGITFIITMAAMSGKVIIGKKMQLLTGGLGLYTWVMLILFCFFVLISYQNLGAVNNSKKI